MDLLNHILVIFFSMLIISCTSNGDDSVYSISLCQSQDEDQLFSQEAVEIVLESENAPCVGAVEKIIVEEGEVYIYDSFNEAIHKFSKEGKYITDISQKGRGPSEYLDISDFDIKDGKVYILSEQGQCIAEYTTEGEFVRKHVLDDWYSSIIISDSCAWLASQYSTRCRYNYAKYDLLTDSYVSLIDPFKHYGGLEKKAAHLMLDAGNIITSKIYDNSIYSLSEDNLCKLYKIDCNLKNSVSEYDLESRSINDVFNDLNHKEHLDFITPLFYNDEYLIVAVNAFIEKLFYRTIIVRINLSDGEYSSYLCGEESSVNKYLHCGKFVGFSEGYFIFSLPPENIIRTRDRIQDAHYCSVKPDDNPVLLMLRPSFVD